MFQNVLPTITDLFAGEGIPREPVKFSWRLIRRKQRPFLLLPDDSDQTGVSLSLYSAQRPLAQLWCSVLPMIFRSPARNFYGSVKVEADAASGLLQFLAAQSGLPAGQLRTPAIKFGGITKKTSRLALLLCDASGRPIRVVKMGLNPEGRAVTEREAEMLAQLPKDVIGCTAMTGRFQTGTLSAFATAYFPGASLTNDAGIEKLFHAWLVPGPPHAVEDLPIWQELAAAAAKNELPAWHLLRASLAGQTVRATLYHGDFTPWNVRMTNLENIQAFDWERGHLKSVPAWDWFHFIVQTAVLVRRYSSERVAAELDHLIQSPRFQKYAASAGISQIIEPLLLAYLLHQIHVVRPLQGRTVMGELFELLWAEWQMGKNITPGVKLPPAAIPAPVVRPNRVVAQLQSAFTDLSNLFWEPSLSFQSRPPLPVLLERHWKALLLSLAWFLAVINLPLLTNPHLMFSPFYLVPCIFLALKADRRLATFIAQVGAIGGPLIFYYARPDFVPFRVICLNIVMRIFVFQVVVILLDRIRWQSPLRRRHVLPAGRTPIANIAGNWVIVLLTLVFFSLVVLLDVLTDPNLFLLPLYLIPCMVLTLALNWRWGTMLALLAAFLGTLLQRHDPGYQPWGVEFWNTGMRFAIYELVVVLLERVRRENILFQLKNRN